jgi:hypothetical protein
MTSLPSRDLNTPLPERAAWPLQSCGVLPERAELADKPPPT